MKTYCFNWPIWVGVILSVFALVSYPLIFIEWPVTRDFPWVNLVLFAIAAAFVFAGIRRGFGSDRGRMSKIVALTLAAFSTLVLVGFIFIVFISAKWLPASTGAPQVGQKAPDFTLNDTNGKQVSLSQMLSAPIQSSVNNSAPKGVLLIFYRGYW